jgi:hypothetical protein
VSVSRQEFPPSFIDTPYQIAVSEFRAVGSSLFTVRAEDLDLQDMIQYGVEGISPAPTYFSCDESSGEIKIARDLRQDRKTAYIVSAFRPENHFVAMLFAL